MGEKVTKTPDADMSVFNDANRRNPRPLDVDRRVLAKLEGERLAAATKALNDPTSYSDGTVARVFRSWGFQISDGAVRNWRIRYIA